MEILLISLLVPFCLLLLNVIILFKVFSVQHSVDALEKRFSIFAAALSEQTAKFQEQLAMDKRSDYATTCGSNAERTSVPSLRSEQSVADDDRRSGIVVDRNMVSEPLASEAAADNRERAQYCESGLESFPRWAPEEESGTLEPLKEADGGEGASTDVTHSSSLLPHEGESGVFPMESERAVIREDETYAAKAMVAHTVATQNPSHDERAKPSASSRVDGLIRTLINFVREGNIWVAGGVVMVLLGFGFLVSFMSERGILSVELRIALAALCGMGMVGFGLYLRLKKPVYAMVMQGGGIGVVYLAAFAAAKLTTLLSPLAAVMLMCLLVLPAVGLALLQNAQLLAIFGFFGGFAAPILLSIGGGDYVLLFSYYTLLNLAILAISGFRLWRWLNLLGATCSFGTLGTWGFFSYHPGMFAIVQPFLIAFMLIYVCITLISVHKREFSLSNPPDISLALGVPLAAIGFQWNLVHEFEHGLSMSALCFGTFYILLARAVWKRWKHEVRRLAEIYAASGILLVNLSLPLEFTGAVTSGIWAAEGALTFFFGCRYGAWKIKTAGLGLQVAAMVSFMCDTPLWTWHDRHFLLESGLLSASLLASAYWWERFPAADENTDERHSRFFTWCLSFARQALPKKLTLDSALIVAGLFWWFVGLAAGSARVAANPTVVFFMSASASSLGFLLLAKLLRFRKVMFAIIVPLVFSVFRLVEPIFLGQAVFWMSRPDDPLVFINALFTHQYFSGSEGLSWVLFAVLLAVYCRFAHGVLPGRLERKSLGGVVLGFLFMLTCSFRAVTADLDLAPSWISFSGLLPAMAYICASVAGSKMRLPERYISILMAYVPAVLVVFLSGWFVLGMVDAGNPAPLPVYIPLFNPLELQQALCIAVFMLWVRHLSLFMPTCFPRVVTAAWKVVAVVVFLWLHSIIVRTAHYFGPIPFGMTVWPSSFFQSMLTGLWGISGAAAIAFGHRKRLRLPWIMGASLIALGTAKLFVNDLSDKETIYHIVSFFIVGGIFLLIGLFAPLPPSAKKDLRSVDTQLREHGKE